MILGSLQFANRSVDKVSWKVAGENMRGWVENRMPSNFQ